MIKIRKTSASDIEKVMNVRLEMLRIVNDMKDDQEFSEELINHSREYFLTGDQDTVVAEDGEKVVGCASISYITIMPTYNHPTGRRAHLMNVYTNEAYRRQGIARKMVSQLIDEAKKRGCTEISLDATLAGRFVYKTLGFTDNIEGMCLSLNESNKRN